MRDPFFIVGNDRSGTTMLRLILDRGPEVAIPPESMFLTDFAAEFAGDAPQNQEAAQRLLNRVWEHPKVRLWELPGPTPQVPANLDANDAYRFVAAAPFEAYAKKYGKPRWGDKTPHYVHHVDQLLQLWPDARFVVLVRDGRDVALSLKRMPFGPNNAWAAAPWWARGIQAGENAQRQHPHKVKTIRYEDLVAEPRQTVQAVCEFLDLNYSDEMLALETADRARIVKDQVSWFPTIFDGITTDKAGRWRREMSVRDQRIFAARAGEELVRMGYEVPQQNGKGHLTPNQERWFHYQNELMRNVNFLRLRLVQERGREFRWALARRLRG
jgi:hypothetical protein